jgi:DNA helicase-2/ATP-dependent DNA helicase PcrA
VINFPPRGIGAVTVEKLAAQAQELRTTLWQACVGARATSRPVAAFVELIERARAQLDGSGPLRAAASELLAGAGLPDEVRASASSPLQAQRRLESLEGFLDSLARFEQRDGRDLAGFLHRLALDSNDDDSDRDRGDTVTLVTLHGAKGLEFPIVFLVGLEEELLPHHRTLYPQGPDVPEATVDLGEERRLFYVGITRARELLYLTRARTRSRRSFDRDRSPSRFLDEIPPELYETREAGAPPIQTEAEADAFARATLDKLRKLAES